MTDRELSPIQRKNNRLADLWYATEIEPAAETGLSEVKSPSRDDITLSSLEVEIDRRAQLKGRAKRVIAMGLATLATAGALIGALELSEDEFNTKYVPETAEQVVNPNEINP